MSLPLQIPQFSSLPEYITESLVLQIEQLVQSKQQLISILSQYSPNFGNNKSLPLVKQEFYKNMIHKQFIQQSMLNVYQWMTQQKFTVEQKHKIWDTLYKLLYLISQLCMNKQKWTGVMQQQVGNLSKRFNSNLLGNNKYVAPVLSMHQSNELLSYVQTSIVPFYEVYQKLLDQNKDFNLKTDFYQPIKQEKKIQGLTEGKKLEINEIMALECLKQFIGDKPPVEEKKQLKKK